MSYLLVANADAGSTDRIDDAAATLEAAGGCRVVWTESPEDVDVALTQDTAAVPVIAGGDGSIHLFVSRLAHTGQLERPVGILPMGTGNDLARGLDLPFDPTEAAQRIVEGRPRPLPLMAAPDGELGVNNAHAGVGVAAARRGSEWKDRLGAFAYTAGSLAEGIAYEGFEGAVEVDGATVHRGPCLAVMVLIGPSAGGGFRPLPDIDVEESTLDVLVIGDGGAPGRLALAFSALRGELAGHATVEHRRGRQVEIRGDGEEWELDGEFRTWDDPVRISLDDRTWSVIA